MGLLKQDSIKNEWVDENITELEFDAGNSEEYEVEAIRDSTVYAKESKSLPPDFYYLCKTVNLLLS